MKINEVEAAVGITKKNIRFYEEAGLLHPQRNSENGYRDYSDADVARLERIKLLRKLDVPLAEIKAMINGQLPLAEGMQRHCIELEHRAKSTAEAISFCTELSSAQGVLNALDAREVLQRLTEKEQKGVRFVNVEKRDTKTVRKRNAIVGASIFIVALIFWICFILWAIMADAGAATEIWIGVLFVGIAVIAIICVLVALAQRMKEIQKGEEDAYRNY